jgi:YHS domain-containing protein
MASFFLRFLFIIVALWFVRRALGLFVGAGRSPTRNQEQRPAAGLKNDTVRDPVCGMYMDPRLAVRIDEGRGSYFFCSAECKEKFLSGRQS